MISQLKSDTGTRLLAAWFQAFKNNPIVLAHAIENNSFLVACEDNILRKPGSRIDAGALGIFMKKHAGKIAGGKFFEIAGEDKHTRRKFWVLKNQL